MEIPDLECKDAHLPRCLGCPGAASCSLAQFYIQSKRDSRRVCQSPQPSQRSCQCPCGWPRSTWPRIYFQSRILHSLEFAYANEFTNWCKLEKIGRPLQVAWANAPGLPKALQSKLWGLTFFNFSSRESDVSASSRGLYSGPSLSWQEVLDAGMKFPPSFCMHCLAPKMRLKWTVQGGQEYDQEYALNGQRRCCLLWETCELLVCCGKRTPNHHWS